MSIDWAQRPLSYVNRLAIRDLVDIDLAVLHCTELPDLATARTWGEEIVHGESATGNSGHFYIDRDGTVEQWVPLERVAHHVRGFNERSVGVELVNSGRYPDWLNSTAQQMTETYPAAQIASLIALLNELPKRLPSLRRVAGHADLDRDTVPATDDDSRRVRRKLDPGPMFPWDAVLAGINLHKLHPQES